jgi:hypothetical protein
VLEESGVGRLNTLCHGDAKPNNFMFRKIDIDFEDDDLKDLSCAGMEAMLIDWQGGFLGETFRGCCVEELHGRVPRLPLQRPYVVHLSFP